MRNSHLKLKSPLKVTFNVTNRCNFKCIHCYNDSCPETIEELSLEEICLILKQLKENEIFLISVNGGEPFLRKDIFKILKKIKDLNFIVNLNSNGSLINKKKAQKIAELDLKHIDISLPAYNESTFFEFTGTESFSSVLTGIKNLIENDVYPHIAIPLTGKNVGWVKEIVRLASELGVKSVHTIVLVEKGRALGNKLSVSKTQLKKVYKNLFDVVDECEINLSLESPFNLDDEMICKNNNINLDRGCFGGRYIACIQANGDVTPCALFPDYIVGNLKEKDFLSIWNSTKMSVLDAKEFNLPKGCLKCKDLKKCYGGCPATYYDDPNKNLPCLL